MTCAIAGLASLATKTGMAGIQAAGAAPGVKTSASPFMQ